MLGPYPARQLSANFAASSVTPLRFATASTSRATEDRQSTTVPKVSKTSALTAGAGAPPPPCPLAPAFAAAITIAPVCRNSRRETLMMHLSWRFYYRIESSTLRIADQRSRGLPANSPLGCSAKRSRHSARSPARPSGRPFAATRSTYRFWFQEPVYPNESVRL